MYKSKVQLNKVSYFPIIYVDVSRLSHPVCIHHEFAGLSLHNNCDVQHIYYLYDD